jgi:hypothetical protein
MRYCVRFSLSAGAHTYIPICNKCAKADFFNNLRGASFEDKLCQVWLLSDGMPNIAFICNQSLMSTSNTTPLRVVYQRYVLLFLKRNVQSTVCLKSNPYLFCLTAIGDDCGTAADD